MRIFSIVLLMFTSGLCYAQDELTRFYYDERNNIMTGESGSAYVVEGQRTENGFWIDTVKSYYTKSASLRSVEFYDARGLQDGRQRYYFESGVLKKEQYFKEGSLVGVTSGYYENASPHYRLKYDSRVHPDGDVHRVIDYWDSTGMQLVKNGNGQCRCYVSIMSETYRQEGNVKDTLRTGEWLVYKNDSLIFREQYDQNKLKSGIRYTRTGQITYTETIKMPQPVDGMENLYRWISKTVKYPNEARRLGYEGTVFVGFVVSKAGELQDIRTVKGVHSSLDGESERVIGLMEPWSPGLFKGQPLAVKYVLPLKFKLAGKPGPKKERG